MQRGIVWVVDDDSSIRWVLERALAGAGLTCTTFENGAEVLEALASKTPDVLLSDIRMPGMDGLALLKQIKQRHPMLPGHHYDRTFRSGCCRQRLSTRGI